MPRENDLTVNHAAEELACSTRKIWDMISKGEVQTYTLGRVRRITRESLDAYKASNMTAPNNPQEAA
jgi:excisionase family DNA binding protein